MVETAALSNSSTSNLLNDLSFVYINPIVSYMYDLVTHHNVSGWYSSVTTVLVCSLSPVDADLASAKHVANFLSKIIIYRYVSVFISFPLFIYIFHCRSEDLFELRVRNFDSKNSSSAAVICGFIIQVALFCQISSMRRFLFTSIRNIGDFRSNVSKIL